MSQIAARKGWLKRLTTTRSLRGFAADFFRNTMLGQKALLYNPKFPRVINVSMSESACFFKCKFCPMSLDEVRNIYTGKSEMEFATLENVVRDVPNDPFYSFDISAFGETLCFDRLAEYITYMKGQKPLVNVTLSTNGVLLTPTRMAQFIRAGLDVLQISVFAENATDHEWLSDTKSFYQVMENTKLAFHIREANGTKRPQIQAFIIGIEEFAGKMASFVDTWSQFTDIAFVRSLYNAGMKLDMTPTHAPSTYRYPCIMPWYATSVKSNGDVGGCYFKNFYGDTPVGNVNVHSIAEIWQGRGMQELRTTHLAHLWKLDNRCTNCDLWDAYTDIWNGHTRTRDSYPSATLFDVFRKACNYRGG